MRQKGSPQNSTLNMEDSSDSTTVHLQPPPPHPGGTDTNSSMPSRSPPASELERLALAGQGSSDGSELGVTTRSGAKRQAASGQGVERASSGRTADRGKKAMTSAARQPGRISHSTSQDSGGDDGDGADADDRNDSEEDSDEDDGPSEEQSRASAAPENPRAAIAELVFKIFSVFEPSQHSFAEMKAPNLPGRSEASADFRQLTIAVSLLVRTQADVKLLEETIDVQGSRFSHQVACKMEKRWKSIHDDFGMYWQQTRAGRRGYGTDVDNTIVKIKDLFGAIEDTLKQFPMKNGTQQRLVDILTQVFETLPRYHEDARSPQAAAPTFAGGATQFEHNLFLRFVCIKNNYLQCLEVLRRISEYDNQRLRPLLRNNHTRWSAIYRTVHSQLQASSWPGGSGQRDGFVSTLHYLLIALGIPPS